MNAETIQRLRSRLGLSQEQFAQRINVSVRTIKRWEAAKSEPLPVFVKAMQELR